MRFTELLCGLSCGLLASFRNQRGVLVAVAVVAAVWLTVGAMGRASALVVENVPGDADGPAVQVRVQVYQHEDVKPGDRDRLFAEDSAGSRVRPQGGGRRAWVYIGEEAQPVFFGELRPIASPVLLVRSSEQAEVRVGTSLRYAELIGDGDELRLLDERGVFEGIGLRARPTVLPGGSVRFESLEVSLSEVVGRLDIGSADGSRREPIPGGRPLVRSETYHVPVTLRKGERAVVLLESASDPAGIFVVEIGVEVATQ